jgi:hypothetical protein
MYKKLLIILVLSISWISCSDDTDGYAFIDTRLRPFLDSFALEGSLRGVEIDWNTNVLVAVIEDIPDAGVAGQCAKNIDRLNELTIDRVFWNISTDMEKEFVIFHELGHCVLERGHLDIKDDNGNCLSIMQSGLGNCERVYNEQNRTVLLDELFSQ